MQSSSTQNAPSVAVLSKALKTSVTGRTDGTTLVCHIPPERPDVPSAVSIPTSLHCQLQPRSRRPCHGASLCSNCNPITYTFHQHSSPRDHPCCCYRECPQISLSGGRQVAISRSSSHLIQSACCSPRCHRAPFHATPLLIAGDAPFLLETAIGRRAIAGGRSDAWRFRGPRPGVR
jgi:hypothetical protein